MKMYVEALGGFFYFSQRCITAPKIGCGHTTCIDALVPPIALQHASSIVVEWNWSLDKPTEMG